MKLHLGCGKRYIPGFVHMDVEVFPHIDVYGDVRDLSMFESNTVDLIYSCHVLEHFNEWDITTMLAEWWRVLKPKGTLRVSVPDAYILACLYAEQQVTLKYIHGPLMGGKRGTYDYHETLFDESKLTKILKDSGFGEPRRWDWRRTEHASVDDYSQAYLPHMDKENGVLISLNIESDKP